MKTQLKWLAATFITFVMVSNFIMVVYAYPCTEFWCEPGQPPTVVPSATNWSPPIAATPLPDTTIIWTPPPFETPATTPSTPTELICDTLHESGYYICAYDLAITSPANPVRLVASGESSIVQLAAWPTPEGLSSIAGLLAVLPATPLVTNITVTPVILISCRPFVVHLETFVW